jgi:hypothetical protein
MMGKLSVFICGILTGVGFILFLMNPGCKERYEPETSQHYAWTVSVTYTDGVTNTVILHKDNDTDADLSIKLNANGCIQTFSETEKPEVYGQNETILLCGVGSFVLLDTKQIETPIELH